jgi:hypothetical protein
MLGNKLVGMPGKGQSGGETTIGVGVTGSGPTGTMDGG